MEYLEEYDLTVFNLFVSEKMVKNERRKRTIEFAIPLVLYSVQQIYIHIFRIIKNSLIKNTMINDTERSAKSIVEIRNLDS